MLIKAKTKVLIKIEEIIKAENNTAITKLSVLLLTFFKANSFIFLLQKKDQHRWPNNHNRSLAIYGSKVETFEPIIEFIRFLIL